ncbi:Mitochondrial substrate carrier family protein [Hirschfeldia incana]|nr:Mitochondrial substrate carrier family protein [Hirschfeldia incana]
MVMQQTEARVSVSSGQSVVGNKASSHRRLTQDQRSHIESASQLLAGGIAGAFSKTCTAPLSRLTILFQVQGMHTNAAALKKPSILHEASRILNEEGLKAFWKGNLVTIAHRLPYSSVNFYTYEHYKKLLYMVTGMENQRSISSNVFVHFVAGGLAGITAASATYPLDLVRTRLAAQTNVIYYTGIWHTLRTICTDEGILGLYKGLGTTLVGVGPSIAISFSAYESLRSYWMSIRPHDSPVAVSLACGSLSGIASSTATFPLDLVRRRKQLEGVGGRAVVYKTGLLGTLKRIVKTEGVRGLYRGILPEYYKVVPGVGICFMTYETLKLYFADLSSKL